MRKKSPREHHSSGTTNQRVKINLTRPVLLLNIRNKNVEVK